MSDCPNRSLKMFCVDEVVIKDNLISQLIGLGQEVWIYNNGLLFILTPQIN